MSAVPSELLTAHFPTYAETFGNLLKPESQSRVFFPGGMIDLDQEEISYTDGNRLQISGRESHLLRYLATHPNRIISREELLLQVWEMNSTTIVTRTIDMHVSKLRDKLHDDPQHPQVLLTIRGEGYLFIPAKAGQGTSASCNSAESALPALAVA